METLPSTDRDIEVEIGFLTEEGHRKAAFPEYRPQFFYDEHDWDARYDFFNFDEVLPGQTIKAFVSFLSPECHVGKLFPGMGFLIREGQRIVAKGQVTKIIELEASAKQTGRDASDCR